MMDGRLISFFNGPFSGDMLIFGGNYYDPLMPFVTRNTWMDVIRLKI